MATSPSSVPAKEAPDPHLELTQAHHQAARLARSLYEGLAPVFQMDLANTQKQTIEIGNALQRIANAERACGVCSGQDHTFAKFYAEMLEQHRLAYLDFERLSRELENSVPPPCSDVVRLAADIEFHLNTAETAHQASIFPATLKKAQ